MAAETYKMSASAVIVTILLFVLLVGGGLVGCPYYKVWERKMAGQAELQYQQGARQAAGAGADLDDGAAVERPGVADDLPRDVQVQKEVLAEALLGRQAVGVERFTQGGQGHSPFSPRGRRWAAEPLG